MGQWRRHTHNPKKKKKNSTHPGSKKGVKKNRTDLNLPGARGAFRVFFCMFLVQSLWVYCSFLPQSKDRHLGIGDPTEGWSGRWWTDGGMEGNDAGIIKDSRVTAFQVVSGSCGTFHSITGPGEFEAPVCLSVRGWAEQAHHNMAVWRCSRPLFCVL